MHPEARIHRCTGGGGRIRRPYTATFLVFAAACGGQFDIGHGASDSGATPDSDSGAVYAGAQAAGGAAAPDGGSATPTVIATQQGMPYRITSDGTRLYWSLLDPSRPPTDSYIVRSCDPSDCRDTLVTYAMHGSAPSGICADGVNVYWYDGSSIFSCPVSGCPAAGPRQVTPMVSIASLPILATGFHAAMVAEGSYVYWVGTDDSVQRCPAAGCAAAPEVLGMLDAPPTSLAVDDSAVYATVDVVQGNGFVGRVSAVDKSGGGTRLIADNQLGASSVAAGGGRVYWTTQNDVGQVLACDVAGCAGAPSVLASGQRRPQSLVVDATRVYFLTESLTYTVPAGATMAPLDVVSCPLAGCDPSPTVLSTINVIDPPMVGTGHALFWIDPQPRDQGGYESATIEGIEKE